MVYHNKFVVAVKSNNKVLREFGDKVFLPFGSEYSLFLKNQSSVRARVMVSIDGNDVLDGHSLTIDANSSVDLERFVSNLSKGNRFKFIERTDRIEQHRGVGAEDGLVRVEWQFEQPKYWRTPPAQWVYTNAYPGPYPYQQPTQPNTVYPANIPVTCCNSVLRSAQRNASADVGITAPGSVSDQQFAPVGAMLTDGIDHSIVLHLCGETEQNNPVTQTVTVKHKPRCVTCGKQNKATAKFCQHCGTSCLIV